MGRGVSITITKKIDFNAMAEKWLDQTERNIEKNTMQMRQAVKYNIARHDNIDTSTLISNLETETSISKRGNISSGTVKSNVSSHPEGHSGYAPILEYGSNDTAAYPNFIPALEEYTDIMLEKLASQKV